MNVFDFDKTIFAGDCTVRFYLYCVKKYPRIMRRWPRFFLDAFQFGIGKMDKSNFKQRFFAFLQELPDVDAEVRAFWRGEMDRIKPWYMEMRRPDDVIISASPRFLLEPVAKELNWGGLIASEVDPRTGKYSGKNCHGQEKVRRYRAEYGDTPVDAFYSDSDSDLPMAEIAETRYKVTGLKVKPWIIS